MTFSVTGELSPDSAIGFRSQSLVDRYTSTLSNGLSRVVLAINGITCAGCVSGIENHIGIVQGVSSISVNASTHRAVVTWDRNALSLERLLAKFNDIGYPALPYQARKQELDLDAERKQSLLRIMVAGALGMQVMMIATALYFGDGFGIDVTLRKTLRFVAMALTIPVLVFCARPFFQRAWHNLRNLNVGMDVPVSLALGTAFIGSAYATVTDSGPVYYESIVMFVFLLSGVRFLETSARKKSLDTVLQVEKSIPEVARKLNPSGLSEPVDILDLSPGDSIHVAPGEIIPADGVVESGFSCADESILTGESQPVSLSPGTKVVAGSINIENELVVRVTASADHNTVNQIARMSEYAQSAKTRTAGIADRIASSFVFGVVLVSVGAAIFWWYREPLMWLPVLVSTLVIACPCALSLATPAAFVSAMGSLTGRGIIPVKGAFLEDLLSVDHIVFDKTGTLTSGEMSITGVQVSDGWDKATAMTIAATLNQFSRHPFAAAFRKALPDGSTASALAVENPEYVPGAGIRGTVNGECYAIGSASFIEEFVGKELEHGEDTESPFNSTCLLAGSETVIARFELSDAIRDDARATVTRLKELGYRISLLSGDNQHAVESVARQLGIDQFQGNLLPREKQDVLNQLREQGHTVAVVGDGLNDAPIIASATVSVAMGRAADLTRMHADVVLLNDRLGDLVSIIEKAKSTRKVIRQNLAWALGYNLLALPAALTGLVPPWAAAIGMSLSSLIVSTNSVRLLKTKQPSEIEPDHQEAMV